MPKIAYSARSKFGAEICRRLGLDNVVDLCIHVPLDGPIAITAEMLATEDQIGALMDMEAEDAFQV